MFFSSLSHTSRRKNYYIKSLVFQIEFFSIANTRNSLVSRSDFLFSDTQKVDCIPFFLVLFGVVGKKMTRMEFSFEGFEVS